MYLTLGSFKTANSKDVIGVFDLDTSTVSAKTREFLTLGEKKGHVLNAAAFNTGSELPKSFVVLSSKNKKKHEEKQMVYISQFSPATIKKRSYE